MSIEKKPERIMFILQYIKKYVEREFGIKDMSKKKRTRDYVSARAIYYKLAKEETGLSTPVIGKSINRDHATVVHSLNKVFPILPTYDYKAYSIYEKYNELKPSKEESKMFSMIEFEELKAKYLDLKRRNHNLQRKFDRILKVKESNDFFDIIDRFNNLDKEKQEIFKVRVDAMLNMIK